MSKDEERVRAVWEYVELYGLGVHVGDCAHLHLHVFADYSAAAAYTDEVLAEAARMREEIAVITVDAHEAEECPQAEAAYTSILKRLLALYDAHVRGLTSEALKGNR